jgi:hypothetical protein
LKVFSPLFKHSVKPEYVYIDVIGLGSGVFDRLLEQGYKVRPCNVAESAKEKSKYLNLRSELYHRLRDWLQEGQCKIPDDSDLIAQCSAVKYKFASDGRIALEKKSEMKKRIGTSPDTADALALTFAHQGVGNWEIYTGESLAAQMGLENDFLNSNF